MKSHNPNAFQRVSSAVQTPKDPAYPRESACEVGVPADRNAAARVSLTAGLQWGRVRPVPWCHCPGPDMVFSKKQLADKSVPDLSSYPTCKRFLDMI